MRAETYPSSSLRFDWLMAALAALVMVGVIQDGWAHAHGLVDQSFFTPWHAILYSCMGISGAVLAATGIRNLRRGYPWQRGLPRGYWTSAIGVLVFASGGVFDLFWHTLYGIETDITGLISVSHLWLALGGALLFAGPIRSIASRYDETTGGWKVAGPLILCAFSLVTLLGFFTQYASLFGDNTTQQIMTADRRATTGGELFTVGTGGQNETRARTFAGHDIWGAAASPDGKFIAYRAQQNASGAALVASDIYVARADGSNAVRITHSGRHDTQPAWSPDGKRLAYLSMPAGTSGNFRLITVNSNGSGAQTILDGTTTIQNPSWSPDGKSIVFQSRNGLHQQLAVVSSSGGSARWLPATVDGAEPFWARNGTIVFDKSDGSLLITDASGLRAAPLKVGGGEPAISPDGKRIAYVSNANGAAQVFVANLDGSHAYDATQLAAQDASHPAWLSNGRIAFTAAGRPAAVLSSIAGAYSIDAVIVSALVVIGVLLLLVRRWRLPAGAITVLLSTYAIALATQSDTYWDIPVAIAAGIAADVYLWAMKDRARTGNGFYALAFGLPFLLTALYIAAVRVQNGAIFWAPNMIVGAPFIAGFAGLLAGFCFQAPLPKGDANASLHGEVLPPAHLLQDAVLRRSSASISARE